MHNSTFKSCQLSVLPAKPLFKVMKQKWKTLLPFRALPHALFPYWSMYSFYSKKRLMIYFAMTPLDAIFFSLGIRGWLWHIPVYHEICGEIEKKVLLCWYAYLYIIKTSTGFHRFATINQFSSVWSITNNIEKLKPSSQCKFSNEFPYF